MVVTCRLSRFLFSLICHPPSVVSQLPSSNSHLPFGAPAPKSPLACDNASQSPLVAFMVRQINDSLPAMKWFCFLAVAFLFVRSASSEPPPSEILARIALVSDTSFTQLVNDALRNYQSTLALSRSDLASSPLVTATVQAGVSHIAATAVSLKIFAILAIALSVTVGTVLTVRQPAAATPSGEPAPEL